MVYVTVIPTTHSARGNTRCRSTLAKALAHDSAAETPESRGFAVTKIDDISASAIVKPMSPWELPVDGRRH